MVNKKEIAVVLSGCGVYDGAEIHESVLTLLAIAKQGADYQIFAPDVEQYHVINHMTGAEMPEKRNVLVEAARIARGNIMPLSQLDLHLFDAVIFTGGFGVAKNLCTFAIDGIAFTINHEVEQVIKKAHLLGKPIGVMCIAPVMIPKILENVEVTIGSDEATVAAIKNLHGRHILTTHGEVVIDTKNKVVSTPCYMLDATIDQIAMGTENLVKEVLKLIPQK